jgi:peptidoglycan/xylan/chitin deacetylase (PgdA/CDA1 family)
MRGRGDTSEDQVQAVEGQPATIDAGVRRRLPRRAAYLARPLAIAVALVLGSGSLVSGSSDTRELAGGTGSALPGPSARLGPNAISPAKVADSGPAGPAAPAQARHVPRRAVDPHSALEPNVRLVYRVHTTAKVVALTFDDGWSPSNGHRILDILVREKVAATFFVNSVYVRWDPDLWKAIAGAGFIIGNHTYLHGDVTTMTEAAIVRELLKNARVFHELTGATMAPLFRPPFGYRNPESDAAAARAGFPTIVAWDTVAGDTGARASDAHLAAAALRGRNGSIVLMHVGPDSTPRFLESVIAGYRARGFSFVTVPQLLALRSPG